MILGLDIDGTITAYPDFFRELTKMVKMSGGKVYVVTSRPSYVGMYERTSEQLDSVGIVYDELHILPSFTQAAESCPFDELNPLEKYLWQKFQFL